MDEQTEVRKGAGGRLLYWTMITTSLLALAQTSTPPVSQGLDMDTVLKGLAGLLTLALVLGGAVVIFFRGFWVKNIDPMIVATMTTWYTSEGQMKSRAEETLRIVNGWAGSREQQKDFEERVKDVIDNATRRDDGTIHREINTRFEKGIAPVMQLVSELSTTVRESEAASREFQTKVLTELAAIKGAMNVRPKSGGG